MFFVRSSKTSASLAVILSASLVALVGVGCDKSGSDGGDKAEAESPEKAESGASGSSADDQNPESTSGQSDSPGDDKPGSAKGELKNKMKMPTKGADIEVSDKDLENFAKVQIRMKEFADSEGMKDKKPKGKKEKIKMMMKMKKKADSVMEEIGMDKNRYAKIGRKMRSDSELQKRLDKKIQELQAAEGDGDGSESGGSGE